MLQAIHSSLHLESYEQLEGHLHQMLLISYSINRVLALSILEAVYGCRNDCLEFSE